MGLFGGCSLQVGFKGSPGAHKGHVPCGHEQSNSQMAMSAESHGPDARRKAARAAWTRAKRKRMPTRWRLAWGEGGGWGELRTDPRKSTPKICGYLLRLERLICPE